MASRKLSRNRISRVGSVYAVTTVADGRSPLFLQASMAEAVIKEILACESEGLVDSHAWIAMPDHIHWLFELRSNSLQSCIQRFKSRAARAMNLSRGSKGAIWQPGFYDRCIRTDEDLRVQAQYIVMNPVRSGIADNIEEYPYWWCRWIRSSADL